jgi:phosphotriesterase-related protein
MSTVNSVLGPIDTAALGFTLMHEHVAASAPGILQNYPELLGDRIIDRAVDGLIEARNGGVATIVDASTFDLGRDVTVLAEASRRSGVNIVATSGWFYDPEHFIEDWNADGFARLFIREIEQGIAGTGIKAGILKSAADVDGVTPGREIMLRAVARAHHQTGIPIMLHSYSPGEIGRQQLPILQEEGVNLGRVKVDHSLDTTDVGYLMWLLEQGCYLGLERCPVINVSAEERTRTIKALIDAGWAHRLLPSHDYLLVRAVPELPAEIRKFIESNIDPYGYLYIKKVVFPQLIEVGISEAVLNSLFTDNPRNFFEDV